MWWSGRLHHPRHRLMLPQLILVIPQTYPCQPRPRLYPPSVRMMPRRRWCTFLTSRPCQPRPLLYPSSVRMMLRRRWCRFLTSRTCRPRFRLHVLTLFILQHPRRPRPLISGSPCHIHQLPHVTHVSMLRRYTKHSVGFATSATPSSNGLVIRHTMPCSGAYTRRLRPLLF